MTAELPFTTREIPEILPQPEVYAGAWYSNRWNQSQAPSRMEHIRWEDFNKSYCYGANFEDKEVTKDRAGQCPSRYKIELLGNTDTSYWIGRHWRDILNRWEWVWFLPHSQFEQDLYDLNDPSVAIWAQAHNAAQHEKGLTVMDTITNTTSAIGLASQWLLKNMTEFVMFLIAAFCIYGISLNQLDLNDSNATLVAKQAQIEMQEKARVQARLEFQKQLDASNARAEAAQTALLAEMQRTTDSVLQKYEKTSDALGDAERREQKLKQEIAELKQRVSKLRKAGG
jgi:hypothetical protein